jgi:adenylate cyclase
MEPHAKTGGSATTATIAFVDLAGFSAIADVYGDASAVAVLELFEGLVREALGGVAEPIKWIGDEAMLAFADPHAALLTLARLLTACRADSRLPLTRSGLNCGPAIRRGNDYFGSTVNIAARITGFAAPGQLIATKPIADIAVASGISVRDLGEVSVRSFAQKIDLFEIELAPTQDPAWIDPVCKMHAPYKAFRRAGRTEPWFCSERCAEAYRNSPETYPIAWDVTA